MGEKQAPPLSVLLVVLGGTVLATTGFHALLKGRNPVQMIWGMIASITGAVLPVIVLGVIAADMPWNGRAETALLAAAALAGALAISDRPNQELLLWGTALALGAATLVATESAGGTPHQLATAAVALCLGIHVRTLTKPTRGHHQSGPRVEYRRDGVAMGMNLGAIAWLFTT